MAEAAGELVDVEAGTQRADGPAEVGLGVESDAAELALEVGHQSSMGFRSGL